MKRKTLKLITLVSFACAGIFVSCGKEDSKDKDRTPILDYTIDFYNLEPNTNIFVYGTYNDWLYNTNPIGSAKNMDASIFIENVKHKEGHCEFYYDVYNDDYSFTPWIAKEYLHTYEFQGWNSPNGGHSRFWGDIDCNYTMPNAINVRGATIKNKPFVEYKAIEEIYGGATAPVDTADKTVWLVMWKDYKFELKHARNENANYTINYSLDMYDNTLTASNFKFKIDNTDFTVTANLIDSTMDVSCKSCSKVGLPKTYRYKMQ